MLPAKAELQNYAESIGTSLTGEQRREVASVIARMTDEQADAFLSLFQAAEEIGEESGE